MPVMEPQTTLSQQCNCKADLASTGHGWPFPFRLSTWRMQVPPDKCKPATGLSWFDHFKCKRHGSCKTWTSEPPPATAPTVKVCCFSWCLWLVTQNKTCWAGSKENRLFSLRMCFSCLQRTRMCQRTQSRRWTRRALSVRVPAVPPTLLVPGLLCSTNWEASSWLAQLTRTHTSDRGPLVNGPRDWLQVGGTEPCSQWASSLGVSS